MLSNLRRIDRPGTACRFPSLIALSALSAALWACGNSKDKTAEEKRRAEDAAPSMCAVDPNDAFNFTLAGSKLLNLNVSASFMPDGTSNQGTSSDIFAHFDAVAPRAVWQREFARALQIWSNYSPVNFRLVSDNGAAEGAAGVVQADNRFGDIRVGGRQIDPNAGYTYYPSATNTAGSDIAIDPDRVLKVGAYMDLYSLLGHEVGHALGLGHSEVSGTMMRSTILWVQNGPLPQDDINAIQAVYGPRKPDAYDAVAANDSIATASPVTIAAAGKTTFFGDLTTDTDLDHYTFTVPAGAASVLSIGIVAGVSLLDPTVTLYDAAGSIVDQRSGGAYGSGTLVQLAGVSPGQTYTVGVSSVSDVFKIGAYRMVVELKAAADGAAYALAPNLSPDAKEFNDSFEVASSLGTVSTTLNVPNLSLHWASDVDFYTFITAKRTATYRAAVNYSSTLGSLRILVFNSAKVQIAASAPGATQVDFPETAGASYFVKIVSPEQVPIPYSLSIVKVN